MVFPSFVNSPTPFMMPVPMLSIQVEPSFCDTLSKPVMPKPLKGPIPGLAQLTSPLSNRPSLIAVLVDVHSLSIASAPGDGQSVCLPCHTPASFASSSCFLPGVAAAMHACMSSAVHPGGSLNSG